MRCFLGWLETFPALKRTHCDMLILFAFQTSFFFLSLEEKQANEKLIILLEHNENLI